MKKSAKAKAPKAVKKEKPDLVEMVTKVREQMAVLEMKVDILIERLTIKPPEVKFQPEPPLRPGEFQRPKENRPPSGNGGRVMHQAVCADCRKNCEVPFKPREGRDVFCKECFSKRRSGAPARPEGNNNLPPLKPMPVIFEHRDLPKQKAKPVAKKKAPKKTKKK